MQEPVLEPAPTEVSLMLTEADTCRRFVTPAIQHAGWDEEPNAILEQRYITAGRIITLGSNDARRREAKRADYLLRYSTDLVIAVVEAKSEEHPAAEGMEQAKEYAQMLDLKFAYATNGHEIIEFDYFRGTEVTVPAFPNPDELWQRLRA
jgi:type I restriction enzyme, R subunit